MAKFDKDKKGSGRAGKGEEEKKGGRSSYKAKRSFTRNKGFRDKEKSGETKGRREGDREWKKRDRPFTERRKEDTPYRDRPAKRPYRERDREEKPVRSHEERERRDSGRDEKPWEKSRSRDDNRGRRDSEDRPKRPFRRDDERGGEERPARRGDNEERPSRSFRKDDDSSERPARRSFKRDEGSSERPARRSSRRDDDTSEKPPRRTFNRDNDSSEKPARRSFKRDDDSSEKPARRSFRRDDDNEKPVRRSFGKDDSPLERRSEKKPRNRDEDSDAPRRVKHSEFEEGRSFEKQQVSDKKKPGHSNRNPANEGLTRLNKYLANAGLASRREADTLIQSGAVKVNGVVVDQLGYKIKPGDKVTYGDESVKGERKVYLLLNKPKDYITTVDDPRDRKTVMELIKGACRERVYPVGRLDRNTTGILLFTNDGELTTKLTHPKFGVKKVYHVSLDKNLKPADFKALVDGIELEDGPAKADDLAFVGEGKREVGIEIHSGRNRIVRRMFEHLGYSVIKLDRVVFAGLTKKDLPRGKHRFLTAKEISFLKMIG